MMCSSVFLPPSFISQSDFNFLLSHFFHCFVLIRLGLSELLDYIKRGWGLVIVSDAPLLIGPTDVWKCSPVSQNGPELSTQARLHQHVQIFTVLERPVQPEHKQQSSFPDDHPLNC